MTTDRFPKIACRKGIIGTKEVTLCGIAKGAGMIQPNMATMLAFVMTDAAIARDALDRMFRQSIAGSFNAISVDGCMSTNDTAVILANGLAGNPEIKTWFPISGAFRRAAFGSALRTRPGTGPRRRRGDQGDRNHGDERRTHRDAQRVAYAIANSNLVKTAFFGGDPNWGRIISAAGSVGIDLPVDRVRLFLEDLPLFADGKGTGGREGELAAIMKQPEITGPPRVGDGAPVMDGLHLRSDFRLCEDQRPLPYIRDEKRDSFFKDFRLII